MGQLAIEDMQISATDTAGLNTEPHFARSRVRVRQVTGDQRGALFF